jgi:imidazolonepropionase-like amidohydrolase
MRWIWGLLAASCLMGRPALAEEANTFAVHAVRVFDGVKTIDQANVIVRDGRIVSVGSEAIPQGMTVVEGAGKTLLPGLIDAHVHVFPSAQADALRFGVTTELDMYHFGPDAPRWRKQRESLERTSQADTWTAGVGVTVPGGHPTQMAPPGFSLPTISRAEDAKAFVEARVKEGSDYIKLIIEDSSEYPGSKPMPTLTRAETCAAIRAAHAAGKLTTVHVTTLASAKMALECGTDGFAHLFVDKPADPEILRAAKARNLFIESTAIVWAGSSGTGLPNMIATDPRVSPYLSPVQHDSLLSVSPRFQPSLFANAIENVRRFHEAGVTLLPASDSPAGLATAHGVSLHEELQLYVLAGFTPEEALRAATSTTAEVFHLGDRGRVAPTYRADLLLVDGDPTRLISDTLSIDRIWKNGYPVDRAPPARTGRP